MPMSEFVFEAREPDAFDCQSGRHLPDHGSVLEAVQSYIVVTGRRRRRQRNRGLDALSPFSRPLHLNRYVLIVSASVSLQLQELAELLAGKWRIAPERDSRSQCIETDPQSFAFSDGTDRRDLTG